MKTISNGNIHFVPSESDKKLPLYLTNVGKWTNQYPIRREEGYPNFQWIQCTGGRGLLKTMKEEYTLDPGQGMLLYPDEFHEYYPVSEPWSVQWFLFNGNQAAELLQYLNLDRTQVLQLSDPQPVLDKIDQLMKLAAPDTLIGYLKCSAVIYEIIIDLFQYGSTVSSRSRHQYFSQLSPALQYIEEHYDRPIELEELASQLSVSRQHTCTLFQQTLGLRPMEYVNKFRISKARELLIDEPGLTIGEVAGRVGYDNLSYFIKMFKRYQGITPSKYRTRG